MASKPTTFRIDNKKKDIIIYTNVEPISAEQNLINFYLTQGYSPKLEEKKKSLTIEDMRKELEADEQILKAFNEAYDTKTEKGKKVAFNETGFAKACKIYNDWKKNNNK